MQRCFRFTHPDPNYRGELYKITTDNKQAVILTEGHYLLKNGHLAPARSVVTGDFSSDGGGSKGKVTLVEKVNDNGLLNLQTIHRDASVNGTQASTFTEAGRPSQTRSDAEVFEAQCRIMKNVLPEF